MKSRTTVLAAVATLLLVWPTFSDGPVGSKCVFTRPAPGAGQGLEPASKVAESDLREILEALGFSDEDIPVFIGPVANAGAFPRQPGMPSGFIVYNVDFLMGLYRLNEWAPVSVLAHEVGHHVGDAQSSNNSWERELNADEVSGCALALMGVSLADAKVALSQGLPSAGSGSHPPTKLRLEHVETAWRRCRESR